MTDMEPQMRRAAISHDGLTLSYLDAGGAGYPVVALHAHWMEGRTYAALAAALAPQWRVITPDQRGHGYSDHAGTYARDDYLGDLAALLDHLNIERAVLLGNSLGGVNAYAFAAAWPDRVRGLVIEDIGVEIDDDPDMTLAWDGVFPTRKALTACIGDRLAPALAPSLRETAQGWRMAFAPKDMAASQIGLNGDHWREWCASSCPALVIRGRDSRVSSADQLARMADQRPGARLVTLPGGHCPHLDDAASFAAAVRDFLDGLAP